MSKGGHKRHLLSVICFTDDLLDVLREFIVTFFLKLDGNEKVVAICGELHACEANNESVTFLLCCSCFYQLHITKGIIAKAILKFTFTYTWDSLGDVVQLALPIEFY